jgi:uridine nucleosidase
MTLKYVWLDVDPGHDDAVALMMACQLENIKLLGVSSVCKAAFSRTGPKFSSKLHRFTATHPLIALPRTPQGVCTHLLHLPMF